MSGGVETALHCCVVLTVAEQPVPAARLAELYEVSPTYLAKQLQALSRAGLVHSVQGNAGGYTLTRSPVQITVLDVVEAIDGAEPAFRCTEIRQRGPLGTPPERCDLPCGISAAMATADRAWRDALRAVTVADLARGVDLKSGTGTLAAMAPWLSGLDAGTHRG